MDLFIIRPTFSSGVNIFSRLSTRCAVGIFGFCHSYLYWADALVRAIIAVTAAKINFLILIQYLFIR